MVDLSLTVQVMPCEIVNFGGAELHAQPGLDHRDGDLPRALTIDPRLTEKDFVIVSGHDADRTVQIVGEPISLSATGAADHFAI